MQLDELRSECNRAVACAIENGLPVRNATIRIVIPRGWKPPKGFPRGRYGPYHTHNQTVVVALSAERVLAYIHQNAQA